MDNTSLYADLEDFTLRNGNKIKVIKRDKSRILCWENSRSESINHNTCRVISIMDLDKRELKNNKLWWDSIPEDVKLKIESFSASKEIQESEKNSATDSDKKRNTYSGFPDFVMCKCGYKQKINKTVVSKKIKKEKISIEQYVESYQCQKCNPTKGRKSKKIKEVKEVKEVKEDIVNA